MPQSLMQAPAAIAKLVAHGYWETLAFQRDTKFDKACDVYGLKRLIAPA